MELAKTPYSLFSLTDDGTVLELQWSATEGMTDEAFRADMAAFADLALEHRPTVLVVDARDFAHRMSEATGQWRAEEIIPRYNRAGALKLAFLLPPEAGSSAPAHEDGADFLTAWFTDRAALNEWIHTA
ncbi:hypothetical protein [Sinomonas sp. G460-2]|uniref:hypothetical protein n=1 Tax=Sinomonas sp. G460-2 TaxID=3393464 RepID=UPI0039EF8E75